MKLIYIDSLGFKKIIFINKFFYKFNNNIKCIYNLIKFYRLKKFNSSSQKNRSLVKFSKKKLYKQKGSGKARVGSKSSPIRISGGRSFPNFYIKKILYKINKKKYKISLKLIIFYFFIENKIFILEDLFLKVPSCKIFKDIFSYFNFNIKNNKLLIITKNINKNFFLSCKKLYNIYLCFLNKLNILFLIKCNFIIIFKSAI